MKETLECRDIEDFADYKIGTGFWVEGFGTADIYFKPDLPYNDIDISLHHQEQIKDAATRAIDRLFLAIKCRQD